MVQVKVYSGYQRIRHSILIIFLICSYFDVAYIEGMTAKINVFQVWSVINRSWHLHVVRCHFQQFKQLTKDKSAKYWLAQNIQLCKGELNRKSCRIDACNYDFACGYSFLYKTSCLALVCVHFFFTNPFKRCWIRYAFNL